MWLTSNQTLIYYYIFIEFKQEDIYVKLLNLYTISS